MRITASIDELRRQMDFQPRQTLAGQIVRRALDDPNTEIVGQLGDHQDACTLAGFVLSCHASDRAISFYIRSGSVFRVREHSRDWLDGYADAHDWI